MSCTRKAFVMRKKLTIVFFFILLHSSSNSQGAYTEYLDQIPISRGFVFQNLEYIFYRYRVSWDEARIICRKYKTRLVSPDLNKNLEFIVEKLIDGTSSSNNYWIGARVNLYNSLIWISSYRQTNPENIIHKKIPIINRKCISINGKSRATIFESLDCSQQLPFICQKENEFNRNINLVAKMHIDKKEFTLYSARVSWPDAVLHCKKEGRFVAEVTGIKEAESLSIMMLKVRPKSIENAWIGGYKEKYVWRWFHSGDRIKNNELWRKLLNQTQKSEACLLLDRHISELPAYIEATCDKKRDILCQTRSENFISDQFLFTANTRMVIDHLIPKSVNQPTTVPYFERSENTRKIHKFFSSSGVTKDRMILSSTPETSLPIQIIIPSVKNTKNTIERKKVLTHNDLLHNKANLTGIIAALKTQKNLKNQRTRPTLFLITSPITKRVFVFNKNIINMPLKNNFQYAALKLQEKQFQLRQNSIPEIKTNTAVRYLLPHYYVFEGPLDVRLLFAKHQLNDKNCSEDMNNIYNHLFVRDKVNLINEPANIYSFLMMLRISEILKSWYQQTRNQSPQYRYIKCKYKFRRPTEYSIIPLL